jgi:hypothetical protein
VSKSVNFIRRARHTYPRIVWVLNTHNSWWKEHEASLSADSFGKRLCRYYRMSKDNTGSRAKTDFVNALVKCHHDYVLRLLSESTSDIHTRRVGRLSAEQIGKFINKAKDALLPLHQLGSPVSMENPTAFFSMVFTENSKNRYTARIEPLLKEAGYVPIMMEQETVSRPLAAEIRKHIAECSLFVVDLTGLRQNVLIETGAAWIQDTPIIFLADKRKCPPTKLPLLIGGELILFYENDDQLAHKLKDALPRAKRRIPVLE